MTEEEDQGWAESEGMGTGGDGMRTGAKHGKGRSVEEHRALREALRTELSELLARERGSKRVAVVGTGGVGANLVDGSRISKDPAVRTLVVTRESRKGRSGDQLVVDPEGIDVAAPPRKGLLAYES